MHSRLLRYFEQLPHPLLLRESTTVGRQRVYVFVYYALTVVIGLVLNLLGISGPQETFNMWLNFSYLALSVIAMVVYLLNRMPIKAALISIMTLTEVSTGIEMIRAAVVDDSYCEMLIVANNMLLIANLLFAVLASLKHAITVLCVCDIAIYASCCFLTGDDTLANFAGTVAICNLLVAILGHRLLNTMLSLNEENTSLRKSDEIIADLIGDDMEQFMTYARLAQKSRTADSTAVLLGMMSDNLRRNVISNVENYIATRDTWLLKMEESFPELSNSEREVCVQIIQGRKLNEICKVLGKKESNITSTRTHIRKKLGLEPGDNLRMTLTKRLQESSTPPPSNRQHN